MDEGVHPRNMQRLYSAVPSRYSMSYLPSLGDWKDVEGVYMGHALQSSPYIRYTGYIDIGRSELVWQYICITVPNDTWTFPYILRTP